MAPSSRRCSRTRVPTRQKVGTIQCYSDQLLMFLFRARAPERYRDRVDVSVAPIIKAVAGFDPTDVI